MRARIINPCVRLNRILGLAERFPEFLDLYLHSMIYSLEKSLLTVEGRSPEKLLVNSCRVQLTGQTL